MCRDQGHRLKLPIQDFTPTIDQTDLWAGCAQVDSQDSSIRLIGHDECSSSEDYTALAGGNQLALAGDQWLRVGNWDGQTANPLYPITEYALLPRKYLITTFILQI
jgi:hypothetical protein